MKTCTVMLLCEGDTGRRVYGVFVGPFRRGSFNLHAADQIASYDLARGEVADVNAMTAAHATKAAPAVPFQAGR